MTNLRLRGWGLVVLAGLFWLFGCSLSEAIDIGDEESPEPPDTAPVEYAEVVDVIDGDTIDVRLDGLVYRVRYIGVNTPERDEPCYADATHANAELVDGQTVTLVTDVSDTDQFGRLLRYVYVGETFVNAELVAGGWAEAREYPPDTHYHDFLEDLEAEAVREDRGCHPTGVFR
jgi:endonuclease YncB( thermonuclease family)